MGLCCTAAKLGLVSCRTRILSAIYLKPRPTRKNGNRSARFDAEFWNLINEFSEPGGTFRSDNYVSNESTFQHVIPQLKQQIKPGGVYLGVGPDQNFTYIAALQPKLAFITDIRRQNMLLHLMYKALFELSANRAEFLSKLFARPMPSGPYAAVTTQRLFELFSNEPADAALAQDTLEAILRQLRDHHQFTFGLDDSRTIEGVYKAFVAGGPEIRYSFPNESAWRRFPSYAELMLENDGTAEAGDGKNHSYMASEENFQAIKTMQSGNRIIPLVGDFAGDRALRSVGRYLKDHGATVSAFYTSNVEFYLFQTEDWKKFLNNVAELPVNADSVFIRAYFNNYTSQWPNPAGSTPRSITLLDSMPGLNAAFQGGHIRQYFDVIKRSMP
jgi:hypothetical protein